MRSATWATESRSGDDVQDVAEASLLKPSDCVVLSKQGEVADVVTAFAQPAEGLIEVFELRRSWPLHPGTMRAMLLYDVASASSAVGATPSRLAKREILVQVLTRADPDDIEIVVAYLAGELRQRRTGVGWATLGSLPEPAEKPSLTVAEVDAEFQSMSTLSGPGSASKRADAVRRLFTRATQPEQRLLRGLVSGDVRQGALDAAMLDAVAAASEVPLTAVRRAAMLRGLPARSRVPL